MKQNNLENNDKELRSSCSLYAIIITLAVVFIVFLLFLVIPNKKDLLNLSTLNKDIPTITDKMEKTALNPGEKTEISLNEEELIEAIGVKESGFPLKNPSLSITPEYVAIKGKTSEKLLSPVLEVQLLPKIIDNKLAFEVKQIRTSGISAPRFMTDPLNQKLEKYLTVSYEIMEEFILENIVLKDKELIITASKK